MNRKAPQPLKTTYVKYVQADGNGPLRIVVKKPAPPSPPPPPKSRVYYEAIGRREK